MITLPLLFLGLGLPLTGLLACGDKDVELPDGDADTDTDTDTDTDADLEATLVAIQSGEIATGASVHIAEAIVTSPVVADGFYLGEGEGGAYSGLWVATSGGVEISAVRGDRVELRGIVEEQVDSGDSSGGSRTALRLSSASDYTWLGIADLPMSFPTTIEDLLDPVLAETLEGVLVEIEGAVVSAIELDGKEFELQGGLRVDDLFHDAGVLQAGDSYARIVGVLHYEGGLFKLAPRDGLDLQGWTAAPCEAERCVRELADGELVLTELMIDPQTGEDDFCEWVELYNASGLSVDLQGLQIGDDDGSMGVIEVPAVVAAGGYAVLARSSEAYWEVECGAMYGVMTPSAWYGDSPNLSNSGDPVELLRPDGSVIDAVPNYGNEVATWQLDSGYLDAASNDDVAYWCPSETVLVSYAGQTDYGTPGRPSIFCGL